MFFQITNAAFFHKRKMLRNNLKAWESQFRTDQDKLQLAGIDLSRRGETLSLADFAAISNSIQAPHD
jgi:16S rRNA (adenine1518-N6/adenine1519-N6)-dimethyltransferase